MLYVAEKLSPSFAYLSSISSGAGDSFSCIICSAMRIERSL